MALVPYVYRVEWSRCRCTDRSSTPIASMIAERIVSDQRRSFADTARLKRDCSIDQITATHCRLTLPSDCRNGFDLNQEVRAVKLRDFDQCDGGGRRGSCRCKEPITGLPIN